MKKPTVFTARYYTYQGVSTWYPSGGQSYVAHLLKHAGASYLLENNTNKGSQALNYTYGWSVAKTAEYWINTDFGWERYMIVNI